MEEFKPFKNKKMTKSSLFVIVMTILWSTVVKAQTEREVRELSGFNGIRVSNSIEAEMVKGDTHEIEIVASGIDLQKIDTKVIDRVLEVGITGSNPRASSVKVTITYQQLDEVAASTSAKIFVRDLLESRDINISASTSSYVEASVKAQNLLLEAETNARIFVQGNTKNLTFNAFTNAQIDGNKLETDNAEVRINTNARGSFHVNQSVKGSAATRGRINYTGDPKIVDIKTNTGGAIEGN